MNKNNDRDNHSSLTFTNVSVRYPGNPTASIENISFTLKKSSINMLIGPNGSGKSTIIKAILNLVSFTGSIDFLPKNINQQIGYVPQYSKLPTHIPITVEEILKLSLANYSFSKKMIIQQIESVLKMVGLDGFESQQFRNLSGGQQQRVLISRALLNNPSLLILDEPESSIDNANRESFYFLLKKIKNENHSTILISTHALDNVLNFADQVICVNKIIICQGLPNETLSDLNLKRLYDINHKQHLHNH